MIEFKLFTEPLVLLLLLLLIGMHAAAIFTKGNVSKIIQYVNIGLHLLLFVPMINAKFHIEEAVLVYLISFFAYTLISAFAYKREQAAAERREEQSEAQTLSDTEPCTKEGEV